MAIQKIRTLIKGKNGQGMTEYIIIVAIMAILSIAALTLFGDNVRAMFGTLANKLTGSDTKVQKKDITTQETDASFKDFNK